MDQEFKAMKRAYDALIGLEPKARERALAWLVPKIQETLNPDNKLLVPLGGLTPGDFK